MTARAYLLHEAIALKRNRLRQVNELIRNPAPAAVDNVIVASFLEEAAAYLRMEVAALRRAALDLEQAEVASPLGEQDGHEDR